MYRRVYVEITNICNMHCSFCHGHKRVPGRMDAAQFTRVLEQLEGLTQYVYYHLMGEPLTHPLLSQFLRLSTEKGFRSVITTNGTLLRRHKDMLLAAKPHKINISVHSFEQGSDTDFYDYLQTIADFAETASNAGILISFRLWNQGHDAGRNDRILAFLQNIFQDDWTPNTRGYRIRDKLFLEFGERFQWPDKEAQDQGEHVTCLGMREHFGILCDGSVVPCCLDSDGAVTLGNIFREELRDILTSDRARAIVKGFACRKATEELCRRCGYARKFR